METCLHSKTSNSIKVFQIIRKTTSILRNNGPMFLNCRFWNVKLFLKVRKRRSVWTAVGIPSIEVFLFKQEICISSLTRKKHVRTYSFSFFSSVLSVSLTFSFLSCFCCSIFLSSFSLSLSVQMLPYLSYFYLFVFLECIQCISPLFFIYIYLSVPFHFVYVAFFLFLSLFLFHSPFLPPSPIKDHPRGRGDAFNSNQNSLEKRGKTI